MQSSTLLLVILCIIANNLFALANESTDYPQSALQCFASSAIESQKDGKIICPPGSNNFCIKEVVNATSRADCGTIEGLHHGRDVWDRKLAQCVYRKCASICPSPEDDRGRTFGGGDDSSTLLEKMPTPVFNRTSYCCDTNLCNQAAKERAISLLVLVGFAAVGLAAAF